MAYESSFGNLPSDGTRRVPGGPETPFRIAVLADFSGRQGREAASGIDDLVNRKPVKVAHDTLDEAIEALGPKLEYSVAGGELAVALDFSEFDDFQPDPVAKQVDRVSDLDDDGATALMREILHHPQYQALESSWRGLEWLLRRVMKSDRIQVVLFDITAEEMAADLMAGDDLKSTGIYRLLIDKTAEAPDGQPWAVLVGNYTFEETAEHAELVGRLAKIGSRCGAPFLAAVTSRAADEGYELPPEGKPAWQALRDLYESAYLGLATPGFLLRPPFGENYRAAESFRFEEFSGVPQGYLWGNPAFACAGLLALGYMKSGWGFEPVGTLALDNMPMHSYRDAEGEAVAVCAEVRFTSSIGQALGDRGLMPLLAVRGRDSVELANIKPLAREGKLLNGRWQGGQGGPPPTSGLPKVSAGIMSKGQSSGRPAPKRGEAAFVSAGPAAQADPETDPDLAALLAGDQAPSDDAAESPPAEESPPDEAPPADMPPDDLPPAEQPPPEESADLGLDPELAALLGGGDAAPAEEPPPELDPELAALLGDTGPGDSPPTDAPSEELDPELAALLGETGPADAPPADAPSEELDPDLAALLGETAAPAAPEATPEMDPDLAALLGETAAPPAVETAADEAVAVETAADEPAAAEPDMDPDLAALLGDQPSEAPASEAEPETAPQPAPAAEPDLDPDLAALLGESAAAPEPASSQEPPLEDTLAESPFDEPAASTTSATDTEPAMATITDDRPDLDSDESPASSATRSASPMAQDLDALFQQVQEASKYGIPGAGSPPVIDFKSLIAPISEDEPAGSGVPFDVREQLEQARKEVNPEAFAPDDPMRPEDFIKADWNAIIAAGARDAPQQVEKPARRRAAARSLDQEARVRRPARRLPFVPVADRYLLGPARSAAGRRRHGSSGGAVQLDRRSGSRSLFSQFDSGRSDRGGRRHAIQLANVAAIADRSGDSGKDRQGRARRPARPLPDGGQQFGPGAAGIAAADAIAHREDGPRRPASRRFARRVVDSLKLAQQILQKKGPGASAGGEEPAAEEAVSDGAGGTVMVAARPRMSTREDIYNELALAASALERLEPHSPVPFLVRRAVELGALPFPLLMQELIRDANVLTEMNRELGIKARQDAVEGG